MTNRTLTLRAQCSNCQHFAPGTRKCTVPTNTPESYGRRRSRTDWCTEWAAGDVLKRMMEEMG